MVSHEKCENTDLGVKIKLYIIYILCIMYWRNWSYRKRKLSSELEQLLTEPQKKSLFDRFFCFCNKKETKYVNNTESPTYKKKSQKQVKFKF